MSTPVIRQAVGAATSGSNATVTLGAGTAVGDLLVIFHGNDWNTLSGLNTPTSSQTLNNMTLQGTADAGTNGCHVKVWTAVVTVGGSQTVTCAVTPSGEEVGCHVVVIDGTTVTTGGTFLDGTPAGNFSSTSTTPFIAPAVTTSTSDALLLCFAVADGSTGTPCSYTAPSGMTEQTDATDGTFSGSSVASLVLSSSGSTGTKSFTPTRSGGYATASIALQGATTAVADPGPAEPLIAPGRNSPGGWWVNLPAIDAPVGVNVTDGTGPSIAVVTGDVTAMQTTTDTTNPALAHTTGDTAPGVGAAAGDNVTTHTTYDATVSTAVILNVDAELTQHTVVAGDPSPSAAITAELTNHAQVAGDALPGVGASAGTGTTSHTAGDALVALSVNDITAPANTHSTNAPAPSIAITDTTAPAISHQTFDPTVSTAVILNVNAPDLVHTLTTGDPGIKIDVAGGAPAISHTTFDAQGVPTQSVNAGAGSTNHTTADAVAGVGGGAQNALHSVVTGDVTSTQTTSAEAPSVAHNAFDATVSTSTAPPAFVGVEGGSTYGTADVGATRISQSDSGTRVTGLVG